jgi:hypothetical protein
MNRQQKIEQIKSQDRVSRISNLAVTVKHLDPEYEARPCSGVETEMGFLEILKIAPNAGQQPRFTARWDQKPEHLDLDMHGASNTAIRNFKNNRNGYRGHHTDRSENPEQRIFEVAIEIPPNRIIFEGEVSFSNMYKVHVAAKAEANVSVNAVVIRAPKKEDD